jgi:hypothetical protein
MTLVTMTQNELKDPYMKKKSPFVYFFLTQNKYIETIWIAQTYLFYTYHASKSKKKLLI